jgi:hypothetical protein
VAGYWVLAAGYVSIFPGGGSCQENVLTASMQTMGRPILAASTNYSTDDYEHHQVGSREV